MVMILWLTQSFIEYIVIAKIRPGLRENYRTSWTVSTLVSFFIGAVIGLFFVLLDGGGMIPMAATMISVATSRFTANAYDLMFFLIAKGEEQKAYFLAWKEENNDSLAELAENLREAMKRLGRFVAFVIRTINFIVRMGKGTYKTTKSGYDATTSVYTSTKKAAQKLRS